MIIIYILAGIIVAVFGGILIQGTIKYIYLTIQDRLHPRFHWDDERGKASPLMAADITKPPDKQVEIIERSKPLSFSEVEDIVNQINFKDHE